MKKTFTLIAILVFAYGVSRAQVHDTIVKWTFPTNAATDSVADGGIGINLNQVIHAVGTSTITYTNTGVTTYCGRATSWRNGVGSKYWQVMFNTTGYDSLFYTSLQKSSGNGGPRDFQVEYRIGKTGSWTIIPVDTIRVPVVGGNAWPTNVMLDTLPIACNNKDSVFLRWVVRDTMSTTGGAIGANSSSSIDNIKVWGHNISGITPPYVTSAILNNLTTATVVFNTPVNATAETVGNYSGLGNVTTAVRSVTQDTVTLTFPSLNNGDAYALIVSNVQDASSIPMAAPQTFHFLLNNSIDTLVITEINYHNPPYPGSNNSDSLEYIELYNNSSVSTRVGGYKLNLGGFNTTTLYTFPADDIIAPNTYLVFAKNANAVNHFYGITGTIQYGNSNLSNTSARISIINTVGAYIDSVTYRSTSPWDTMAHGHGPSLVLCNPSTSIAYNSDPANWLIANEFVDSLAHIAVYGNPGAGCTMEGISNYSNDNTNLNCYPNPTRNNLTIAPNAFASDISMFDILGNVVFEKKNVSSTININTSGFNTGMYFIRVTYSNNKVASKKIAID